VALSCERGIILSENLLTDEKRISTILPHMCQTTSIIRLIRHLKIFSHRLLTVQQCLLLNLKTYEEVNATLSSGGQISAQFT
jgi:hypothetical protein